MSDGKLLTAKELNTIEKRNRECVPLDGSPLEQDEKDRRDLLEHVFYQHRVIENCTESNRQLREELGAVKKMNLFSESRMFDENARIRRALAAAKEALESDAMWAFDSNQPLTMKCSYSTGGDLTMGPNNCKEFFTKRKDALARIAECEKGT